MRITSFILLVLSTLGCLASDEDFFYSSGKIFVVVSVLLIIFLGIVLYLIRLERRVNKLEKKENEA